MPPEAPGHYFTARIRGGDVAAVSSPPRGRTARREALEHVRVGRQRRRHCRHECGTPAGNDVLTEPFDVMDAGRMAVFADPEGAVFMRLAGEASTGARGSSTSTGASTSTT